VTRTRLDLLLVNRGLSESRARAGVLIRAGQVLVRERVVDKPGTEVPNDAEVRVRAADGWASRGAHKLLGALEAMPWLGETIRGADCLDIGASTGGFTDVLLRHGARQVVALDVGYGQLHWRLRTDPRVTVLDRVNVRELAPGRLPFAPGVITCDTSFISLTRFLDVIWRELIPGGFAVLLVKPQFEVGREQVGKGGVVLDETQRRAALDRVESAAQGLGFAVVGSCDSPLPGPKGNREWLLVLRKPG
jgi:23S rRNA (cytidine1920-2'-O)/16S rRNA (cytidine1409-2'-O)-methyltransferase